MLKTIPSVLTPELLHVLASMGHGDSLAVVDANFPAASAARATVHGRAIYLAGVDVPRAVQAILSLLPLDTFVSEPVKRMQVVDDPDVVPEVQEETIDLAGFAANDSRVGGLERFAFYDSARSCYGIVATGERRFYGNFLIAKGVIGPQEQ